MITDTLIHVFQSILSFLINLLPNAPIVAVGNGAAGGTACCAAFLIASLTTVLGVSITTTGGVVPLITGGIAGVANSPIALLIDWTIMGFAVGCALAFLMAFFIVRIFIIMWQQVKW